MTMGEMKIDLRLYIHSIEIIAAVFLVKVRTTTQKILYR